MSKENKSKGKVWMLVVGVFLAALALVFDIVAPQFETSLSTALRGNAVDESAHADALQAGYDLNVELEREGAVLLRNDGTLPIDVSGGAVKVNVFGIRSAHLVLNSAGSASGSNAEAATLKDGLEAAGFEVNPGLWEYLAGVSVVDNTGVDEGGTSEAVRELGVDEYTGDISIANAKSYSEYAIVTFSRLGGEGADQARTDMGTHGTQGYLELADNEKALLEALQKEGYKTIVLINSSYAMELGPLEDYNVAAALWIGGPGVKGALAIGELLAGVVNPSGRLADTYAYDLSTAPTFITADNYVVNDEEGAQIGGYTDYSEGIYVGYRWYETADAEGFWSSEFAASRWNVSEYKQVVQYPFGYGLSYTTFEQKFKDKPEYKDGVFKFEVEVKNTGDVAGKEVVEVYVEVPYTAGGVETSKVALAAFGKTQLLEPGASEAVELTVKAEDIASYDMAAFDGQGGYVLAGGDYQFYLSSGETGAHCWANPQDSATVAVDAIQYGDDNKRESDVVAAHNLLQAGAVRDGQAIQVLSRANAFANAEATVFTAREDYVAKAGSALYEALVTNQSKAGEYQGTLLENLTVGQAGSLKLADLTGAAYDDERWDQLIAQMSLDDLIKLTGTGGWSTPEIESIGKNATTDIDGPFGLSNFIKNTMGNDVACVSYATEVVAASTRNVELIEDMGEAVAAEAEATNTSGWYAPGSNLHRTPFGGRNPEYFSEDPLLSGKMCAAEASGALSRGLYVYIKHFAFNDTEANRTLKQNCYMDEQTARELYLRPFEIAIKNGSAEVEEGKHDHDHGDEEEAESQQYGATGLMSSYMWFGENWNGANYNLMTRLLREEWGFTGMVVTDNAAVVPEWITLAKAIYGGTDLMLVYNTAKLPSAISETDAGITALKTSAHHILWTISDAAARRGTEATQGFDGYKALRIGINVVGFVGGAALIAAYFLKGKKGKEAEAVEA